MSDIVAVAGVLFSVLFLVSRVIMRRGGLSRSGPLAPNSDELVLSEFEGSRRHRVTRGLAQPIAPAVFSAKSYHEVRTQIVNLQALLVNPSLDVCYRSRARWHTALAGLLDQLDDLTRPSGDEEADEERFARLCRQVEGISLEISHCKSEMGSRASV